MLLTRSASNSVLGLANQHVGYPANKPTCWYLVRGVDVCYRGGPDRRVLAAGRCGNIWILTPGCGGDLERCHNVQRMI